MEKNKLTNLLLGSVIVLLCLILFRSKIQWFFKGREILSRAWIGNIPNVAVACFGDWFVDQTIDNPTQNCASVLEEYQVTIRRWDSLIKQYRDLDCNDFLGGKDAKEFYHYISGEVVDRYDSYYQAYPGEWKPGQGFGYRLLNGDDGNCHYDPYGLDSNGDCNACENYH